MYGPDLLGKCLSELELEGAGRCRRASGAPSANVNTTTLRGLLERGDPQDLAEEIAARTVNKERARSGEAGTLVWTTPSSAPDGAPVTGVPVTGA